jgi:hypothetical protein
MNVLVLAQNGRTDLRWLPVQTSIDENVGATMGHAPTSHPILEYAGIEASDLKFWAPDNVVADATLMKPWQGGHRTVIEVGTGSGLLYAALLEVSHGRGTIVLNQMRCVSKFDVDPAARALLAGLLEYGLDGARETRQLAVLSDPGSPLSDALADLAVMHDNARGRLSAMALNDYGVLMVDSAEAAWDELLAPDTEQALFDFLHKHGGTLWVHDLTDSCAGRLSQFLKRLPISVVECPAGEGRPVHKLVDHPLTRGLSNQTLWWAPPNISSGNWRDWSRMQEPMVLHRPNVNAESAPPGRVTHLLSRSGLVHIRIGNGAVVLDQVRWVEHPTYRTKGLQYASVLLTNLGVDFGRRQVRDVPDEDCVFIDLAAHCNQGFNDPVAGDGKGGWTDQGPELDLRNLPVGTRRLAGVPFRVIDPAENDGRSCVVMRGYRGLAFPEHVEAVPLGERVERVHILHGSAWAKAGQRLGEYVFAYADGERCRFPVIEGTHVHDWYWGAMALGEAEPAWVGAAEGHDGVALYCTTWENPRPGVAVESVSIVAGTVGPMMEGVLPSGMLGVVGMTGVRAEVD